MAMEPKEAELKIVDTKIEESSSSEEDNFGPLPVKKKKKVLPNESIYVQNLPTASLYEKSHKHADNVLYAVASNSLQCIVTASANGDIKLWKKEAPLTFIKKYTAAADISLIHLCISWDELSAGILGHSIKSKPEQKYFFHLFDILTFDISSIMHLKEQPKTCELVHSYNSAFPLIAISFANRVAIYSADDCGGTLLRELKGLHEHPVSIIKYNGLLNVVVSLDESGSIEFWDAETLRLPPVTKGSFEIEYKSSTDLYELQKKSTYAISLTFSPDGKLFALLCADGIIRVYRLINGKLIRSYDESLDVYVAAQNDPKMEQLHLDKFDFGRRFALEKELEKSSSRKCQNILFDESGNILIVPTLIGVKLINLVTNRLVCIVGRLETERPLCLALLQGKVQKKRIVGSVFNKDGTKQNRQLFERDPILVTTAYKKSSKKDPELTDEVSRDVIDEVPSKDELQKAAIFVKKEISVNQGKPNKLTLYTNVGDIVIKLLPESAPRAVDAFINLARTYKFQNYTFYRVIKNFMIQAGIDEKFDVDQIDSWLKKTESSTYKFDRPFTVSLTGSTSEHGKFQFFITTVPADHLNGEYPIVGRVIQGSDVVTYIENREVNDDDQPLEKISINSIKLSKL